MKHLEEVGETYFEHCSVAVSVGVVSILAGLLSIVHGLIPQLFTRAAGDAIIYLADIIQSRRL